MRGTCWNTQEDSALQGLPLIEQVIYLRGLRRFMNYKTGVVGDRHRRISYQSIAETLHTEPTSGRHKDKYADISFTNIRTALKNLEKVGLLERLGNKTNLVFFLPIATTDNSDLTDSTDSWKAAEKPQWISRVTTENVATKPVVATPTVFASEAVTNVDAHDAVTPSVVTNEEVLPTQPECSVEAKEWGLTNYIGLTGDLSIKDGDLTGQQQANNLDVTKDCSSEIPGGLTGSKISNRAVTGQQQGINRGSTQVKNAINSDTNATITTEKITGILIPNDDSSRTLPDTGYPLSPLTAVFKENPQRTTSTHLSNLPTSKARNVPKPDECRGDSIGGDSLKTYTPKNNDSVCNVRRVFDHWVQVMHKGDAKLDKAREALISSRLREGYFVETLMQAIDGCALSPWHIGQNPQKRKFNDLELILRCAAKVEYFSEIAKAKAAGGSDPEDNWSNFLHDDNGNIIEGEVCHGNNPKVSRTYDQGQAVV
jgi:hypothetical protein